MFLTRMSFPAADSWMHPLRSWRLIALAMLAGLAPGSSAHAELRTWKSSNGKFSVQAELTQTSSRDITLRRSDGTAIHVALNALSAEDKQFVSEYREANSVPVSPRDEFGESIDLLPLIEVGDASKGTWARDGDAVVTGRENRTQMAVP